MLWMANVIPIVKRIQMVSDGGRQVRAKLCTCPGVIHKKQKTKKKKEKMASLTCGDPQKNKKMASLTCGP